MSQPDRISLAPWEQTGDEEPGPTFRVELDGRFFLIQLVSGFVRFRELSPRHRHRPSQWNFAIRHRVSEGTLATEDFLRSLFEDEWRRGRYGRIVCVEGDEVVFLGRTGAGFILSRWARSMSYSEEPRVFRFRFGWSSDFDSHPARYWQSEVDAWDVDEDSDFRFAFDLANEDENGKARLVCLVGGGWREMERVARLILLADARWNDAFCRTPQLPGFNIPGVRVQMRRGAPPELTLAKVDEDWYGHQNRFVSFYCEEVAFPPGALWQAWLAHFVRGFDQDKLRSKTEGQSVRECSFVITGKRCQQSAHERLEAALFLRDCLSDKLPAAEIEALLR